MPPRRCASSCCRSSTCRVRVLLASVAGYRRSIVLVLTTFSVSLGCVRSSAATIGAASARATSLLRSPAGCLSADGAGQRDPAGSRAGEARQAPAALQSLPIRARSERLALAAGDQGVTRLLLRRVPHVAGGSPGDARVWYAADAPCPAAAAPRSAPHPAAHAPARQAVAAARRAT